MRLGMSWQMCGRYRRLGGFVWIFAAHLASGQASEPLTRQACVQYALGHAPALQRAQLEQAIAQRQTQRAQAEWLPQANLSYDYTYFLRLQTAIFPDFNNPGSGELREVQIGVPHNSSLNLDVRQTLFRNDLHRASRAAPYQRLAAEQATAAQRIATTVAVSTAFYDLVLGRAQVAIYDQAQERLEKNVRDARSRYEAGLNDRTDYQRATVQLRNVQVQRRALQAALLVKETRLREVMNYPSERPLVLADDLAPLRAEVPFDTAEVLSAQRRIEVRQLRTEQALQQTALDFHRWDFLPSVSAFYRYGIDFLSPAIEDLYDRSFPYSFVGVAAAVPLFRGLARVRARQEAELRLESLGWARTELENRIRTEYTSALAGYQASRYEWEMAQENQQTATAVYRTLKLQYDEGVKTYVEVILAENDLRTAQLGALEALQRTLHSRLALEEALGLIE